MDKNLLIVLCNLIIYKVLLVNCDYISVVGSKTLRIDEAYKVAVTSHSFNATGNKTVLVAIVGKDFEGGEYEVYKNVSVAPGETSIAKLKV